MGISAFVKRHPVSVYFVLTFTISWGCILVATWRYGGIPATKEQLNAQLPVAIVAMLGGPSISGILLTGLVSGKAGFRGILSRMRRWRVGARWYVVALLTAPLMLMATLLVLSLFSPVYLPGIFASDNKVPLLLSSVAGGVVTGICEELGWTGFAVPRLRLRYGILTTGLIVGVLWGAWHILSNDVWGSGAYSGTVSTPVFLIVNGFCFLVGQLPAFRVLTVWVYDRTDSLLVTMLMHASLTASTMILQPLAISGISLLVYSFASAAVMWAVVAALASATRGQLARQPLPRKIA